MGRGIFATVEHRKLMELKNCGAVDVDALELLATIKFESVKETIIHVRKKAKREKGAFQRFFDLSLPVAREVEMMFTTRPELVEHLNAVEVPTRLCPVTQSIKDDFLFFDRAARYSLEAREILDMFKRHHEVVVDPERSAVVDWILQNSQRIRDEIKGAK